MLNAPSAPDEAGRRVLYVDMAYTYDTVRRKRHEQFFEARHSGGLFERVIGVHPIADLSGNGAREVRSIAFTQRQTVIEGVSRRHGWRGPLAAIDFILSQAGLIRMLVGIIRRERIDLIVATDPVYSGLFGAILKFFSRRPLVIAIYANYDLAYATFKTLAMPRLIPSFRIQTMISGLVLRAADFTIAGNQDNLDWGLKHGADPDAAAVVTFARNIQPCHLADPAGREGPEATLRELGVPDAASYMIMISRLIPVKFAEDGVRAMIRVAQDHPDVVGIIAGEGALQPQLEALVEAAGLSERIRFVGHIDQDRLSRIEPACITVSPLTGMALVEAGLAGSPIVAYDADWQAEFVHDGVNGFVVPMGDHGALARGVLTILRDPEMRARMSAAAREAALRLADPARIIAADQAVFRRILQQTT
jgi:glycosyltransferase involved in cell wall biosynthesis